MSMIFKPGQRWTYDGLALCFERELGDELLVFMIELTLAPLQLEDSDGRKWAPSRAWALEAFASGRLKRVPDVPRSGARRQAAATDVDSEFVEQRDKKARLRAFVVRWFDDQGEVARGLKAIERALARLWREEPEKAEQFGKMPSAWSVRRWLDNRGTPGERPLRQMISMTGRVQRSRRFPPETLELLRRSVAEYWSREKLSKSEAYSLFHRLISYINKRRQRGRHSLPQLKIPRFETFRLEVNFHERFETFAAKYGPLKAKARFKTHGEGLTAARALQLGCMDHNFLDTVVCLDADWMIPIGRPWVTVLIDVRTRCIVGFVISFEPPSLYSVTECIKRANRPKLHLRQREPRFIILVEIYGRFDEIVVDNGWEFAGNSLEDVMNDAGTTIRWAPVRSPTYKAVVERFFRTLNNLLAHKVTGAVYKPELLRQMGYDPYKDAVLTLSEIEDLMWEAICYYHKSEHRGIGMAPADLWQRDVLANGIDVIGDDSLLDKIAGKTEYPCKVTRGGVRLFGLQYHDQGLVAGLLDDLIGIEPVRKQQHGSRPATATVKVHYNPANISEIHVWNRRRKVYVTLPCADKNYVAGMSLWHHRQVQAWAKDRSLEFITEADRLAARARLVDRIQSAVPSAKIRDRRAKARLLSPPSVHPVGGHRVSVAYAPPRHDGLAPIIDHEPLASHRNDGGLPSPRPAKGRRNRAVQQSKPGPTKAEPINAAVRRKPPRMAGRDPWEPFE